MNLLIVIVGVVFGAMIGGVLGLLLGLGALVGGATCLPLVILSLRHHLLSR